MENRTTNEVGRMVGVSGQRVQQVLQSEGIKKRKRNTFSKFTPKRRGLTTRQRFNQLVDVRKEDECWEFQGVIRTNGYGYFHAFKGLERYAHRVAYLFSRGKRAKDHVLHSCDNPKCCNPNHLRNGTPAENMRDRDERGRAAWAKDYTSWHRRLMAARPTGPRVSRKDLRRIKAEIAEGRNISVIAEEFGVCRTTIYRWLKKT